MPARLIEVAKAAYTYPLLIKQLLHAPMIQTPYQQIVDRGLKRLGYADLPGCIGRLASGLARLGARPGDTVLSAAHASQMRGASNPGYLDQLLALTGWTSLPWPHALRQPTLLARLIPNAGLELIDDGHLFFVSRPVEMAAIVPRFLETV